MDYKSKWPQYAQQWDGMKFLPNREKDAERAARHAVTNKTVYQKIEAATGVPWPMIACNHWQESNGNFNTYLGNGQPLDRVTTITPKGRGPFIGPNAFVLGAIDAYKIEDTLTKVKDWRLEKMLYWMERFNGAGYHNRGLPSPYIWGGTNIQKPGKFGGYVDGVFFDNKFFPDVMYKNIGCAPILFEIAKLDPSVLYVRETAGNTPIDVPVPKPPVPPEAEKPLQKSKTIWGGITSWLATSGAGLLAFLNDAKPWLVAVILIGGSIGLFLVWKGRLDVQKVVDKLVGPADKTGE